MFTNRDQHSDIQSVISQSLEKVNEVLSSKKVLASFRRTSSNYSPELTKNPGKDKITSAKVDTNEVLPNVEVEECDFEVLQPRNTILREQLYNSLGPSGQNSINILQPHNEGEVSPNRTRQNNFMNATAIETDDERLKTKNPLSTK